MSDQMPISDPEEANAPPPNADQSFGMPQGPETSPDPKNLPAVPKRGSIEVGDRGIQIKSLAELAQFSRMVFESGLAPRGFKTVQSVAVAVQKGLEHGLSPLAGLSAVYVVGGIPAWTGKAALGLIFASGKVVPGSYRCWVDGKGDSMAAHCESQRVGHGLVRTSFSAEDAKRAGAWGKKNRDGSPTPWVSHPDRMLRWKAISHHAVDVYPDILGGFPIAEDILDVVQQTPDRGPRESTMAAVQGTATEDKLLAAAGVTVSAPEPEETGETGETDKAQDIENASSPPGVGPSASAQIFAPPDENRFANLLASMDDSESYSDLEQRTYRALTAAGENKAWQAQVKTASKKLLKRFPAPSPNTRG